VSRSFVVATMACMALVACSSGSSTSSQSPASGASFVKSTLLGTAVDSEIVVQSHSASLDRSTARVAALTNDFTLRSRDAYGSDTAFRRFRYGKPRNTYHPERNYTVPLTQSNVAGQKTGTGTAVFTSDDVENSVTSRTFTVTDVVQSNSVFGIFSTNDVGLTTAGAPREFLEIHAYAAGTAVSALPNNADYSGRFLAQVISDSSTGATQIDLAANLNVNFLGNMMTGTIGDPGAPDIVLNGSVSGAALSGTATVNSSSVVLANGATGAFQGSFYGPGAVEGAGTLGISDTSGTTHHEMVGAFGVTKN